VAAGTRRWKRGEALFALTHWSSVCESYSAALAVSHGASTGTSVDIWSSRATTAARSAAICGSGGAVPVAPLSEYSIRSPSAQYTFWPSS
jgi:hypothetical protein